MPNVNKVILMGVLGRNPETKQFPNGGSVTTFSLATAVIKLKETAVNFVIRVMCNLH